jgi:cytochrome P450
MLGVHAIDQGASRMVTTYDFWSPEAIANPYPLYARVRAKTPVFHDGYQWIISRYHDMMPLLLDPRLSSARRITFDWLEPEEQAEFLPLSTTNEAMMLFLDPPSHTRLRGLVAQAFSARMIEGMRPRIQELVDDILDAVAPDEVWDVMPTLAIPLPGLVIAELLGVPTADRAQFKAWANDYAAWLGMIGPDEEQRRAANRAVIEMSAYIREQATRRRHEPRGDLLTALVQAEEAGDRLSEQELVATCFLLLFAGNETTTNLIGNGLLALLEHPNELARLRQDPSLIRTAIEELLRYESPVQFTSRVALEPLEIGGQQIASGDIIFTMLGAANRDPDAFADPDRLDISRRPNKHVAFLHGIHFCLGAPLARAEGQIAIQSVVQRFPHLQLATDTFDWQHNNVFRGLRALPVAG